MEKREGEKIGWEPVRRKGSRRFQREEIEAWKRGARKVVETVGSVLWQTKRLKQRH
jgi:predicted RNA binding protein YcfA (HicA-like mRNA interferase family)